MDEKEILVPETKIVKIADREYAIGKLKMRIFIQLSLLIMRVTSTNKEKLEQLRSEVTDSSSNQQDLAVLLGLLENDELSKVVGFIIGEKDTDFISKNLEIETLSEIVAIVCEQNKFETVKKNIDRIMKVFK